jgi:hypothetical protein
MDLGRTIKIACEEMGKHTMDTFVENPPSIAHRGHGVVMSGCPGCRKKFQSVNQFIRHSMADAVPAIADLLTDPDDREDCRGHPLFVL